MTARRKQILWDLGLAAFAWMALGASMGLYYLVTMYSGRGWPLPHPEALASLIIYYFSETPSGAKLQTLQWLLTFPLAGIVWITPLAISAPYFDGRRAELPYTIFRFAVATLPLAAVGLWTAYLAGSSSAGFSLRRMVDVSMQRVLPAPPSEYLHWVYVAAAVGSVGVQVFMYRKVFDVQGSKAFAHFLGSAAALFVMACGIGYGVGIGLRSVLR